MITNIKIVFYDLLAGIHLLHYARPYISWLWICIIYSIYSTLFAIVLSYYNAAFLCYCLFLFILWWGCWSFEPFWQEFSLESLRWQLWRFEHDEITSTGTLITVDQCAVVDLRSLWSLGANTSVRVKLSYWQHLVEMMSLLQYFTLIFIQIKTYSFAF